VKIVVTSPAAIPAGHSAKLAIDYMADLSGRLRME
jgi:hypothetical protein